MLILVIIIFTIITTVIDIIGTVRVCTFLDRGTTGLNQHPIKQHVVIDVYQKVHIV